jgi:hypothetical protein
VPEILLQYRLHDQSVGCKHSTGQLAAANRVREKQLRRLLGEFSQQEFALHCGLGLWQVDGTWSTVDLVHDWLCKLYDANNSVQIYANEFFMRELASRWWYCCHHSTGCGMKIVRRYFSSPLSKYTELDWRDKIAFMLRAMFSSSPRA